MRFIPCAVSGLLTLILMAEVPRSFAHPAPIVEWAAIITPIDSTTVGREAALELSAVVPDGWHVYAARQLPGGPTPLRVTFPEAAGARVTGSASGTTPQKRHDQSFDLDTEFYTGAFTVRLPMAWQPSRTFAAELPVDVRYQICSDRECLPPKTVHLFVSTHGTAQK